MPFQRCKWLLTGKQTENLQLVQKCGFNYTVYTSPWPFFDFINTIIVNHYLFQWFPVQSPNTSAAILFVTSRNRKKTTFRISPISNHQVYHAVTTQHTPTPQNLINKLQSLKLQFMVALTNVWSNTKLFRRFETLLQCIQIWLNTKLKTKLLSM